MLKYIYIGGRKFYRFGKFKTWQEAYDIAMYHKREDKSKYFILKAEAGFFMPYEEYILYLDNIENLT